MIKRIRKIGKQFLEGMRDNVKAVFMAFALAYMLLPVHALAASGGGEGSYVTAITNLKTVMTTILVPVGAVLIIWGGVRFAIAFQKMDQNGEHSAIYTIVAGGICVGITAVVTALS